jgi:hypothetical protein
LDLRALVRRVFRKVLDFLSDRGEGITFVELIERAFVEKNLSEKKNVRFMEEDLCAQ